MINNEMNAIKDRIGDKKITLKAESSQHVDL